MHQRFHADLGIAIFILREFEFWFKKRVELGLSTGFGLWSRICLIPLALNMLVAVGCAFSFVLGAILTLVVICQTMPTCRFSIGASIFSVREVPPSSSSRRS